MSRHFSFIANGLELQIVEVFIPGGVHDCEDCVLALAIEVVEEEYREKIFNVRIIHPSK